MLPFLPPKQQQSLADRDDPTLVQLVEEGPPDPTKPMGEIAVGESTFGPLASVALGPAKYERYDELLAALREEARVAFQLDPGGSTASHSVVQRQNPAAALIASALTRPPCTALVHYHPAETTSTTHGVAEAPARSEQMPINPRMTGLQVKSSIIASLGLKGGFQDYYLTLDAAPFGSRTPVERHPSWDHTSVTLRLEDVAGRPKAVGHT